MAGFTDWPKEPEEELAPESAPEKAENVEDAEGAWRRPMPTPLLISFAYKSGGSSICPGENLLASPLLLSSVKENSVSLEYMISSYELVKFRQLREQIKLNQLLIEQLMMAQSN